MIRIGQHFDRHRSVQPCVARFVDFAHATGADGREDLYGPRRAAVEGHAWWILPRINRTNLARRSDQKDLNRND
jgi:hypothetical protein